MSSAEEAAILGRLDAVLGRIQGKTGELESSINAKMSFLPGPLQDKVVSGWNEFCGFMKRIWDNVNTIIANMGSPSALEDTANAWSDLVGGPVSSQVQAADAGLLEVDTNWDGDAAEAYRRNLPMQKVALDKIKSALTDGISTTLGTVATAIKVFWGCLIGALAALVVGIISALASSATIFGMPAAPFIAAGAALAASVAAIVGAENLKSACEAANSTLRQKLADNTGFYNGHWPPAAR